MTGLVAVILIDRLLTRVFGHSGSSPEKSYTNSDRFRVSVTFFAFAKAKKNFRKPPIIFGEKLHYPFGVLKISDLV